MIPEGAGVRRRQEKTRTQRQCEVVAAEINGQVINP
jgi:hypothetical protein